MSVYVGNEQMDCSRYVNGEWYLHLDIVNGLLDIVRRKDCWSAHRIHWLDRGKRGTASFAIVAAMVLKRNGMLEMAGLYFTRS